MREADIVFRMDGSRELGLGHIMRCMVVAKALIKQSVIKNINPSINFVTINYEGARNVLNKSEFSDKVRWISADDDSLKALKIILDEIKPDIVITDIDLREILSKYLETINPVIHVSLHEHNFSILTGDRVIAPTIRPLEHHANTRPGYSSFTGADYVLLPLEILELSESAPEPSTRIKTATITMGGGDPSRLTEIILNSVRACNNPQIDWRVIFGPASGYNEWEFAKKFPANIQYFDGVKLTRMEFLELLSESDLVITNAGTTVYEALALGRPVMAVPQNDFESVVAGILGEKGVVVTPDSNSKVDILETLAAVVEDNALRQTMASAGKLLIDGRGALRVADIILEKIR